MRSATIERKTAETAISLMLSLDGAGKGDIQTGCGFLDHMLTLLAAHARFDLLVRCTGDTQVDDHHTVEDIGIALGQALRAALGDQARRAALRPASPAHGRGAGAGSRGPQRPGLPGL